MRRANGRVGGKPRVLRDIGKAFRRPHRFAHCRFARATGTAASQGFRTAHGFETGRMACDAPHRRATRSWPKTLGRRLYGSISRTFGITRTSRRATSSIASCAPAVTEAALEVATVAPVHGIGLARLPVPHRYPSYYESYIRKLVMG